MSADIKGSVTGYKLRMKALTRYITDLSALEAVDASDLDRAQAELNEIADIYRDSDLGEILYKIYELQAYIYFFRGDCRNAQLFIEEAEGIRKRPYIESKLLREHIEQKIIFELDLTNQAFRKAASQQILIGVGAFLAGVIVTGIIYSMAQQSAEQEAINSGQTEYSFHYVALTGLIIYGAIEFFKGVWNFINCEGNAKKAIQARFN